jgi:hypothetical protein
MDGGIEFIKDLMEQLVRDQERQWIKLLVKLLWNRGPANVLPSPRPPGPLGLDRQFTALPVILTGGFGILDQKSSAAAKSSACFQIKGKGI